MKASPGALLGRRIHIAGSAAKTDDRSAVQYTHDLVKSLVERLVALGATFVVPIDREPRLDADDPSSPARTFDWTVLAAAWATRGSRPQLSRVHGSFIRAVSHRKVLDDQIPVERQALWREVLASPDIVALTNLGEWNVGAMRREAQTRAGDVLVAFGGDEGVLHLANLYHEAGKPVVPINVPIQTHGRGAALLCGQAEREPTRFFRVQGHDPSALLATASCVRCPPAVEAAAAIARLLAALAPPTAFCIRLTKRDHPSFARVDRYFRYFVEPVIQEAGYEPLTIAADRAEGAFLNVEVFTRLHRSQLVLADFTAERPNCFIEMGYALARQIPTIIMAERGTESTFDIGAAPALFWSLDEADDILRDNLRDHWAGAMRRAAIVSPDPYA